jgi:hypothetical protein|eukprot:COSAG01_NODE_2151_length_8294_cov_12.317472_10_plen_316_part_00
MVTGAIRATVNGSVCPRRQQFEQSSGGGGAQVGHRVPAPAPQRQGGGGGGGYRPPPRPRMPASPQQRRLQRPLSLQPTAQTAAASAAGSGDGATAGSADRSHLSRADSNAASSSSATPKESPLRARRTNAVAVPGRPGLLPRADAILKLQRLAGKGSEAELQAFLKDGVGAGPAGAAVLNGAAPPHGRTALIIAAAYRNAVAAEHLLRCEDRPIRRSKSCVHAYRLCLATVDSPVLAPHPVPAAAVGRACAHRLTWGAPGRPRCGAKTECTDIHGWTAFHYACASGEVATTALLLRAGCDPAVREGKGRTGRCVT